MKRIDFFAGNIIFDILILDNPKNFLKRNISIKPISFHILSVPTLFRDPSHMT